MKRDSQLLIVDDNAATRYAMRRVLERHGYRVLEAGTGEEGLHLLDNEQIDALLLDVNLPDMSGFDIARQLRADNRTALMPIIHVSAASVETGDIITGLDAGADAYLIHPVDPDVLLATLRTLLRVRDTEHALRESEGRFREIFANIAAPIAVIDAQLKVRERNDAFRQLFGEHAAGEPLASRFVDGQQAVIDELSGCLAAGERWRGSLNLQIGGQLLETQWQVSPYREPDLGLLLVEDVTEQRQRERTQLQLLDTANTQLALEVVERARTEAQLLQAQKMDALGKLTGGIAHDFNNLLTGIITGLDLIKQRLAAGRSDDVMRFADAAMGSATRAAALTHRLLAFARQQPLDAQPVDVNAQVRSLEDLLRRTIGERIGLTLELAPGLLVAQVDASQLDNAVLNLVINARDALPEGGHIRVSTFVTHAGGRELAKGEYVVVRVADDGVGIDPAVIDNVFDPFFTTKPLGQGTGLGLSTIYGFARQTGGEVRICSEVGTGTEVSLLLPASKGAVTLVEEPQAVAQKGAGEHILVVEDMRLVRMLVTEMLGDAGYRCSQAASAEEALPLLESDHSIQLMLSDVGLPGMSGRQLADAARRWRPQLPILFITGYAQRATDRASFLGERMDMLGKPFESAELLERVRRMLDVAQADETPSDPNRR